MDTNKKREIIMEHYKNPFNKNKEVTENYKKVNSNNESCIDDINLYVLFEEDIIKDISFDGEACAISTSSTSIMIKSLIGKTKEEALNFIENFENMIEEKEYSVNLLKEAIVYDEIYKQKSRKICALLPYKGLKKILK